MSISEDLDPLIVSILSRSAEPLALANLIKRLPAGKKPTQAQVVARLTELSTAGQVHRWPGKAARFTIADPEVLVQEQVLRALESGPLTEGELKKQLPTPAKPLLKTGLAVLKAQGKIVKHPKLGRRTPFGLGPPNASDYLPLELDVVFKRLAKLGFDEAHVKDALRRHVAAMAAGGTGDAVQADDADAEIFAAMSRLNRQASRGALVNLSELRAAMQDRFPDRSAFDRAVLSLAQQGKVQLQTHPWPGSLSPDEQAALVPNGRGGFFDAIGLRLE